MSLLLLLSGRLFSYGSAFFPSVTLYPGADTWPGQGLSPLARCRISYDDVSAATPNWVEVANVDLRGFGSSRGREQEQSAFDAGTASVTLDNRDRAFDPNFNSAIRPFNQLWLYYEFHGVVDDIFKGYVSAWELDWPGGGWSDATAVASAADEFVVLTLGAMPTTSPPRSSYSELVQVDNPAGYWPMTEVPEINIQPAVEVEPNPTATDPRITIIRPRPGTGGVGGGGVRIAD